MPRPNTDPITQSIDSLRTESSPDSVTPARVANLLQAIVDLINALSMVPDAEVADIMQLINNAVSTANAASSAASAAQTNANNKRITQFKAEATADGVTLTVKQSGHTALTFSLPVADASQAGIVLPSVFQSLLDAGQKAENFKLSQLLLSYTSSGVMWGIRLTDGTTLQKTIGLATASRHGIMDKADKEKLDSLPENGVVGLDAAGRVPATQAPAIMLRNVTNTVLDDLHEGDFYFDSGNIFYVDADANPVPMGPPSKNVVYCHTETNILYRWTGTAFDPAMTDPNFAMQKQEVRRNNATQKIYSIPNGKLVQVIATTDVVNIQLLPATTGASVHRIIMYAADFQNTESINWPDSLIWADNDAPEAQRVTDCRGILVTIYDMKFAEYNEYGR